MLERINYFIISIIIFEILSFILGYGTHFDHYKYAIMLTIVSVNYLVLKRQSALILIRNHKNSNKGS